MYQPSDFSIVTATNAAYLNSLKIMLYSLHENMHCEGIRVCVLVKNSMNSYLEAIYKWGERYTPRIEILSIVIPQTLLREINRLTSDIQYITPESWYRLFVFDLVENLPHNILYLDADMVVRNDIAQLMKEFIASGSSFSAVEDSFLSLKKDGDRDYFNCGLLVFRSSSSNADKFRLAWQFGRNNPGQCPFNDQSALNRVYNGDWHHLDHAWNYQTGMIKRNRYKNVRPKIIHYTCDSKPWHLSCRHPYKQDFHHYGKSAGLNILQRYNFSHYLQDKVTKTVSAGNL